MYERVCYQKLDEPILVWMGLEFRQVVIGIGSGAGTSILAGFILGLGAIGLLLGVGVGAGVLAFFRFLRTGGPGYIFSRIYRMGILEILPRPLRPRHLLPLSGGGRVARFRLSPVLGEEPSEVRNDARKYFGR